MKGIIFTTFLEKLEAEYGIDFVDDVVEEVDLVSGGAYTAVGNYEDAELLKIVAAVAEKTASSIDELVVGFGRYLFGDFVELYGEMIGEVSGTMDLLERVENFIHPEVVKLYPDALPPRFHVEGRQEDSLVFVYESSRCLSLLAEGLIQGAVAHFNERIRMDKEHLEEDGSRVRFELAQEAP